MSLHVACGLQDPITKLLRTYGFAWSETLAASGGVTTLPVPADGRPYILHLTAQVAMYVAFGLAPNAAADPRILLLPGNDGFLISAQPGFHIAWVAKP